MSLRKVTRRGTYGILMKQHSLLLVQKKKGCYKGLLDLPGGGIEEGESVEEALKREFHEEVCLGFQSAQFLAHFTCIQSVQDKNASFVFHHLGAIYFISHPFPIANSVPEELSAWYPWYQLSQKELTPFASMAIKYYAHTFSTWVKFAHLR